MCSFQGGALFLVKQNLKRAYDDARATAMVVPPAAAGARFAMARAGQPRRG
jgi:hypothetical protein